MSAIASDRATRDRVKGERVVHLHQGRAIDGGNGVQNQSHRGRAHHGADHWRQHGRLLGGRGVLVFQSRCARRGSAPGGGPVRELPGRGAIAFAETYPNCQLLRDSHQSFSDVACVFQGNVSWDDDGEIRPLQFSRVTPGFFGTMGVFPVVGRAFGPAEEGRNAPPLVVISHALWQREFAGRRDTLGASIRLAGVPHTVIGIMPRGFVLPAPTDVWLPYDIPASWTTSTRLLSPAFARLAPGVTEASAQSEMAAFTQRTVEMDRAANRDYRYRVRPIRSVLLNGAERTVLLVQAGALVLLGLAIANLWSLFIAWAVERQQETAIRRALGASGGQVVKLFLTRALALIGLAGVLGYFLAWQVLPAIQALNPSPSLAFLLSRAQLHQGGLAMTIVLIAIGTLAAGLIPAWHAWKQDPATGLRTSTRGSGLSRGAVRWQQAVVLTQAAFAVVILFAATLSGLSFRNLLHVPSGFDARDRVVVRVFLPEPRYSGHASRAAFADAVLEQISRESGIATAGFTTTLPVGDIPWGGRFFLESAGGEAMREPLVFNFRRISDSYFNAIGLPLLKGRAFDRRDREAGAPVAIISQAAARRLWPGEEAVGKRLRRALPGTTETVAMEVVGVVTNTVDAGYAGPAGETVYVPYAQVSADRLSLVVRPRDTIETALAAVRRALKAVDPTIAAFKASDLDTLTREANAMPRLQMSLLAVFGLVAIGMTALGSHGVMSQLVASRQRELAVRLAVGDTPAGLLRAVLKQNARLSLVGIAVGLVGAWAVGSAMTPLVFGIAPRSLSVLGAVAAATLAITLGATVMPAWRAARVDVRRGLGAS